MNIQVIHSATTVPTGFSYYSLTTTLRRMRTREDDGGYTTNSLLCCALRRLLYLVSISHAFTATINNRVLSIIFQL